jgi:hypothetical protein
MTHTLTRRQALTRLGTAALMLGHAAHAAPAGPPLVEILAFAHPPVQSALKPLRDWLARQGTRLKVVEFDLETPAGEKRLKEVGIKGHQPVVVLINGSYRHTSAAGKPLEFIGFPASSGTPAGVATRWTITDVMEALK